MNEINDGGVNQQLTRRFNIVDTAAPAGSLAPEVFPVVQVTPPSIEEAYLRGEFLAAGCAPQVAGAAQYSNIRLANLAGSNILCMVDRIIVNAGSVAAVYAGVSITTTLLSNVRSSGYRDTRIAPFATARGTIAVLSSETNISVPLSAAGSKLLLAQVQQVGVPYWYDTNIVLAPGRSFEIGLTDVNQYLFVTIFWRERRVQPSELG